MNYHHIELAVIVEVESSEEIPYLRAIELAKENIHDSKLTKHGENTTTCKILEVY
jgi:hypothetical protein